MRTRPNAEYRLRSHPGKPNDLYRRFKKAFAAMVAVENPAIARHEFGEWFVRTPDLENALEEATTGELDSLRFLLGSTGIGKSTILRYVFEAEHQPVVRGNTLVIPFCFKNEWPVADRFNPVLAAAAKLLLKQSGQPFDYDAFYAFIMADRPDLLEITASLAETATNEERLRAFREAFRDGYELEKLKWLVKQTPLIRVILILDDIEALPYGNQSELAQKICKAYTFLQHQVQRTFGVKALIACRPRTHTILRKEDWYSVFSFDEPIRIEAVVDLEQLFTARFRSAIKQTTTGQEPTNRPDWDRAYEILVKLIREVSGKCDIILTALCNNNVRRALYEFQYILTNRKWFQRDRVVSPSFTVEEAHYAVNEAAIYRALALRNGDIYPAADSVVSNLLHNTPDESSDLLVTYVIRYLLHHKNAGEQPGNAHVYASALSLHIANLLPGISTSEDVNNAIAYMREARLLEAETVEGKELVALAPKAEMLWRMFQSNSLYLAFFHDDCYHDSDDVTLLAPEEYHYPEIGFLGVLRFLRSISSAERARVNKAIDRHFLRSYIGCFGEQTLARYLYGGVQRSIKRVYSEKPIPPEVVKLSATVLSAIKEVEIAIRRNR